MEELDLQRIFAAQLSDSEFSKLSKFIYTQYGIKMPPEKRIMLQSRLQKRLRALKIYTFKEYIDYAFQHGNDEIIHMMDVVSTNKTDFYREPSHFEFLQQSILPKLYTEKRQIKVWSAGCSSGQEVYTLAIELSEFSAKNSGFDYSILGTDISTLMLKKAYTAIYTEDMVSMIPLDIKKKYLLKSKEKAKKLIRINNLLRNKVRFQRINFMDDHYGVNDQFDIIFCRNVLIYFDRETQEKVINKLCNYLRNDGFFFLGHSESITNLNVPLKQLKPTVYSKNKI
ncbi:MAG: CheR family methyltransferase [Bacteroidales bacterium]